MDDPARDIERVIRSLTQTKPSIQRQAIDKYFTSDASFTHPFCRTGSFDGSRFLMLGIYRWYKVMSPYIDIKVNSVAYDASNLILYVNISQVFRIYLIPFFAAPVNLTTVLRLKHDKFDNKYYIKSQDDLYQVDQFIKFILPGGWVIVYLWHFIATLICVLLAAISWPVSYLEEEKGFGDQRKAFDEQKPSDIDRATPMKKSSEPSLTVTTTATERR